jgi:hypothetical protein
MTTNPQLNGKHLKPDAQMNILRVFRVEPGTVWWIRTLSDHYGGIITHWHRGRSHYCVGKECNPIMHRGDKIWKGYAPVEIFLEDRKKWFPFVLEISEHLELDFRGIYRRGQIWELFRSADDGKKKLGCEAILHETCDLKTLPPAFDFTAPVKSLYHTFELDLTVRNPLPPRIIVQESDGEAPSKLKPKVEANGKLQQDLQEEFNRRRAEKASPTAKKKS